MAHLSLDFPEDQYCYSAQLTVRVTDINAAKHLGFGITRPADGTLVAMAKSGLVFFDYRQSRVVPMPATFSAEFPKVNRVTG